MPVLSPAINPQSVLPKRQTTMESAQNFISGGSVLGSSVVSSASNKIVGFQRAAVRPATPDINSIVSTISSNILNQVDNSIKNATNIINKNTDLKIQNSENQIMNVVENITPPQNNQVTQLQTVVERIQNQTTNIVEKISEDYKKRVGEVDSARPNNLLTNFIQLYKTAIDFIKFFGDRRNINTLRDNLVSLRESFSESFEVAKLIRNTIVKIVGQLSSLPSASPGSSSGINLDVNVPGGGLKKTLPPGAKPSRMRGGKLGMLGLGLGGIAAGGAAVNALAGSRDQTEPVPTDQSIPGQILDTFTSIISRFANAVDEMIKGGEKSKSGSQGSASSSGKSGSKGSPPATQKPDKTTPGKSTYTAGTIPKEVSKDTEFTKGVTEIAKKYNVPEDYLYAVMGFETGGTFNPAITNKAGSGATGLIQFMPDTAKGLGTTTDALAKMTRSQQLKYVDKYFSGTLNKGASLSDTYMSVLLPAAVGKPDSTVLFGPGGILPGAYAQNAGLDLNKDGKVTKAEATKQVEKYLPKVKPGIGGPETPDWVLSPEKREELRLAAQTVSQPPPTQTEAPTVTTLPLDMSGGGGSGQKQASGPIPAPIRNGAAGPSVPFLTSSDPENFLVLYSKMVYNIVGA